MCQPEAVHILDRVPESVRRQMAEVKASQVPRVVMERLKKSVAGQVRWPLYLYGPVGTGKSFAGLHALRRATGMWLSASWWPDLRYEDRAQADRILEKMGRQIQTAKGTFLWCGLVVVDEIGLRERATDWQLECLLHVLNARRGLPMIVTGNLSPVEVAQTYDGRVADRLCNAGTVVKVEGASLRDWREKESG